MIIILLSTVLLVSLVFLFKAIRSINKLEEANEQYVEWNDYITNKVNGVYVRMQEIDSKGIFEADDEVGYVFKELLETIDQLKEISI